MHEVVNIEEKYPQKCFQIITCRLPGYLNVSLLAQTVCAVAMAHTQIHEYIITA